MCASVVQSEAAESKYLKYATRIMLVGNLHETLGV